MELQNIVNQTSNVKSLLCYFWNLVPVKLAYNFTEIHIMKIIFHMLDDLIPLS